MEESSIPQNGSYHVFVKRASILGITNLLVSLRGLMLIPVITRSLGASDFGIWSQIMVMVFLTSNLSLLGLQSAITRFLSSEEAAEDLREGFYSVLCIGIALSLICTLVAVPISGFVIRGSKDVVMAETLPLALWLIPLSTCNLVANIYILARRWIGRFVAISLWRSFGEVFVIAVLLLSGGTLRHAILGSIAAQSIAVVVMMLIIMKSIGFTVPTFSRLREFLLLGLPTLPALLSQWIVTSSDRVIIGFFLGSAAVGIYSAGYGLGRFVFLFSTPLYQILVPTSVFLWERGRRTRAREFINRTLKLCLIFSIPAAFGLAVLAGPFLEVFATADFVEQGRLVVPLVGLSAVFFMFYVVVVQAFNLVKNNRPVAIIWASSACVNFIGNLVLVPLIGITGAAIATAASYGISLFLSIVLASRYFLPSFPRTLVAKSLASSVIMCLVITLLHPRGAIMLGLTVLFGASIYFACLWVLRAFTREEIEFARALLGRGGLS